MLVMKSRRERRYRKNSIVYIFLLKPIIRLIKQAPIKLKLNSKILTDFPFTVKRNHLPHRFRCCKNTYTEHQRNALQYASNATKSTVRPAMRNPRTVLHAALMSVFAITKLRKIGISEFKRGGTSIFTKKAQSKESSFSVTILLQKVFFTDLHSAQDLSFFSILLKFQGVFPVSN